MAPGDHTQPGAGTAPDRARSRARRRPPWRFRLRVHISTLFVTLIAAAGLAVVGYGYRATSALLLSAGDEEFLRIAEHTAERLRALLTPARLLVELLARHPLTRVDALAGRLDTLPLLTAALGAHPEISAVYVGYDNGDFFLVRALSDALRRDLHAPAEAAFLVQSVAARDHPTPGRYLYLDRQLGVVQSEPRPAYRFDPRTRDWYRQAVSTDAVVRTRPYAFFTTREIGTTLAQRSATGRAVVGADLTLQALSQHLVQARVTPSAQIALVDPRGLVIAHPVPDRLVRPAASGELGLVHVAELGEPALARVLATPGEATRSHTTLALEGRAWIGARRAIGMDAGEPVSLVLAAPRDELVAQARGLAQRQLAIALGVLGLTLGLVWLAARRISRPLESLTRSVERMGRGDSTPRCPRSGTPSKLGRSET
jgi:hypothetical protein